MDETTTKDRTLNVTYALSGDHTEEQARELIQGSAPSGFVVQNIELNQENES